MINAPTIEPTRDCNCDLCGRRHTPFHKWPVLTKGGETEMWCGTCINLIYPDEVECEHCPSFYFMTPDNRTCPYCGKDN